MDMTEAVEKEMGRELAVRMMAQVRMSARREHHEAVLKRLKAQRQYVPAEYHRGYETALAYLQQELDNELNWRVP